MMNSSQERLHDVETQRNMATLRSRAADEEMPLMRDKKAAEGRPPEPSGHPVVSTVLLPDGTSCEIEISMQACGCHLFDKVCDKLNLLEKEYFSCSFMKREVKFWLKMDKPIKKQIKGGPWQFAFEVKFYPMDPSLLHEELTRYQVFLQVRDDICNERLPCSFVTLTLLGLYTCVSQLGEYDADEHGSGIDYIKRIRFAPVQTEEMLERIAELHRIQRGQSPGDAEMNFLSIVKNMALYGVHMHPTVSCSSNEVVNVGVCAIGLVVYRDRIRLHRFVWAKIIKILYKRNIFTIQVRPYDDTGCPGGKEELTYRFKLANIVMAKRLWRLAVEHHAFFRLQEPERMKKKRFSMMGYKYRYTGPTQYQSQQAAEQITRSTQSVNRLTACERFAWDRTLEPGTPYSIDRSEEVVMEGYKTATLDLKRRNRSSVPIADSEDDDASHAQLLAGGEAVAYRKTLMSTSSTGDVFMTLPGQYDDGRRTPDSYSGGGGTFDNRYAGRTPYPREPDGTHGYMTPGYDPNKGVDELRRELGTDEVDSMRADYQNGGYGTSGPGGTRRAPGDTGSSSSLDDHLRVKYMSADAVGGGMWTDEMGVTRRTKTSTRTYTDSDGNLITEHRTEKDGIVETHIEKRTRSMDLDHMDHDKALADAIFAVTDMNPDMSVEKIEITKTEEE